MIRSPLIRTESMEKLTTKCSSSLRIWSITRHYQTRKQSEHPFPESPLVPCTSSCPTPLLMPQMSTMRLMTIFLQMFGTSSLRKLAALKNFRTDLYRLKENAHLSMPIMCELRNGTSRDYRRDFTESSGPTRSKAPQDETSRANLGPRPFSSLGQY